MSAEIAEILVATCSSVDGRSSFMGTAIDPNTGATLRTFKGEEAARSGLALAGSQFLLASHPTKPLVNVWTWNKEQVHARLACPGRVNALACSPDGTYIVAAVSAKIYVWQAATGDLLALLTNHYLPVKVIRFMDDGAHFVTSGDDHVVIVWRTASVVSSDAVVKPLRLLSDHSLPVTDIYCGYGRSSARVVTTSLDQTCKVYAFSTGEILLSRYLSQPLTAVAVDPAETRIFAGSSGGNVYQINLYERTNGTAKEHATEEQVPTFRKHYRYITSLAVAHDASALYSGSIDGTIIIWDIASRQCLKELKQRGPVANLLLAWKPPTLDDRTSLVVAAPIQPLKRQRAEKDETTVVPIRLCRNFHREHAFAEDKMKEMTKIDFIDDENDDECPMGESSPASNVDARNADVEHEIHQLRRANEELYRVAVDRLRREPAPWTSSLSSST